MDIAGEPKYRLGPVEITGDAIDGAAAVYDPGSGGRGRNGMADHVRPRPARAPTSSPR